MPSNAPRRLPDLRDAAALAALTVTIAFAAAILALPTAGIVLHEIAGALLLALIGLGLAAGWPIRDRQPRPFVRLVAALLTLVGVGSLGALLAIGALPAGLGALPLAGLALLAVLLADSVRSGRSR